MIQITPQMRIWVAVDPVDFRKGIDGLAGLCRQQLQADPMDGALFVFCSLNRRALKCWSTIPRASGSARSGFQAGASPPSPGQRAPPEWRSVPTSCSLCCGTALRSLRPLR